MRYIPVLIGFLFVALAGCGGDSSGDDISDVSGTWAVQFGILGQDDCGLLSADLPGFIDRHTLVEDHGVVTFNSQNGFIAETQAPLNADHSFQVTEEAVGVPFGDGVECQISSSIGYTFINEEEANVTLFRGLNCADGFTCQSRAVGTATLEPVSLG